jgi:two-component system sensor histidine kinase KdpD
MMIPFRSRISVDTAALVLVIPVVIGVAIGGFPASPVGVVAGFLAYDFFFIPPYGTLRIGAAEHWLALAVYVIVGLAFGLVVSQARRAQEEAQRRQAEAEVLFQLSESLASDTGTEAGLRAVVRQVRAVFGLDTAAVLLPDGSGIMRVAACDGSPPSETVLRWLAARDPLKCAEALPGSPGTMAVPLASPAAPVGMLMVAGEAIDPETQRLLVTFATHAALAVERARLVAEATRSRMLEEVDRLRSALVDSVSHDLRTPLASIKASISDLADPSVPLDDADRAVLLRTVEEETDRLARFVSKLLDMSQIETGALDLHPAATPLAELVTAVVARLEGLLREHPLELNLTEDLPLVEVDYVLVEQVLANLLENAARYSPPGSPVAVTANHLLPDWVEVRVVDHGPGIPESERMRIFERFYRATPGGPRRAGTGMGLAICQGVVAAHRGQIWVESTPGGGATLVFRLPVAATRRPEEQPVPPLGA